MIQEAFSPGLYLIARGRSLREVLGVRAGESEELCISGFVLAFAL